MPFKSYAQMSFLKHRHPEIYKRWKEKYGEPEDVPRKIGLHRKMAKKR